MIDLDRQALAEAAPPDMEAPRALTLDFLRWIDSQPRTYAETLDAWHTSCPRLPVWEDAFSAKLVCLHRAHGVRMSETPVMLTPRGRTLLREA